MPMMKMQNSVGFSVASIVPQTVLVDKGGQVIWMLCARDEDWLHEI